MVAKRKRYDLKVERYVWNPIMLSRYCFHGSKQEVNI